MGGGRRSSDHLPAELADDGVTSSQSSSDRHPDDSPLSYSPEITVAATDSAAEEEVCYNPPRRKTYNELLESYSNPPARKATLRETKDLILRHKPGDWIEEVGGTTVGDYEVSDCTTLLLIGPRGSGKSTLINRITRVFEDDQSTPHRAQVSHNLSATLGTCFLQEYMIPRKSKSLCIYDTRSLSSKPSDNVELLQCWMTRGVSHGEMVIRQSDDIVTRNTIKSMVRQGVFSPYKKRVVNFVILVVNGVSILEWIHAKDNGYVDILLETFKYPFLSFKDNKPALVITHGDELSISQRACVRMYLGELLGIPPVHQIFDIADMKDEDTELAIVDMLRYCIEHADRNLPFNQNYLLQGQRICHSMMEMLQGYDTILEVVAITLCIILLLLRGIVNLI
ncbi:uncharacterized protein LOC122042979 isoform X2 [Zingiber officinale]|uniref:uncharacterized protein LOC122042979 isoform X2 n=1 Tax=Zingiber officinale TaxID=94328 RepID=UPI001C4B96D1|nr:uncharacterized protein LOC122042979 isoform X2 [Zingiber officinale]